MGFETPGSQLDQAPPSSVETAEYATERQDQIDIARRERAFLSQETCRQCWPDVPDHAADFLREHCPEHFALAMDEAAKIEPADLADPDVAEFLLEDCVAVAEQVAAASSLNGNTDEIATRTERVEAGEVEIAARQDIIAQQNETIAENEQSNEQRRTTVNGLRERISGNLTGSNKLGQIDQLIADVQGAQGFPEEERSAALQQLGMIRQTLVTMGQIVSDPQERAAFESILSASSLNLSATSNQSVFADVMTRVETSDQLSEETKTQLRASLGMPEVNTGSQAQDLLRETQIDEHGNEVPVWPEDKPLNVRPGVDMYSDANQRQYMRAEFNGHITTIDTTGWRGETVGKYLEALSFIHDVESFGGTGLFQSIYQIDFNLAGEEGFDPQKVDQILNIMGKWFGGFEHADGDVRQSGDRRGFIRYVVRLLNKRGTATGFEESQADTNEMLDDLSLRNSDGSPNWEQIDRLGEFARSTYLSGDADYHDLKAHLIGESEPND